jgi:hypothetical protein
MRLIRSLHDVLPAIVFATLTLMACIGFGEGSPAIKKANETSALAQLKKFNTVEAYVLMEEYRYIHDLDELVGDDRSAGLFGRRFAAARHGAPDPSPMSGYYFSSIVEDEHGAHLDDPFRCGLAAYPAKPGRTGDRVLLILLDEKWDTATGPVSSGNYRVYWASHERVAGPVTRWPTESELRTDYVEIRQRTPEEGLREAEELYDDYKAGKPGKDPVFGDDIKVE